MQVRAARMAAGLARRGLRTDDALAVLAGNGPEFVVAREAATALELRFVPLNPRLTPPERDELIARSRARAVVVDPLLGAAPGALTFAELDEPGGFELRPGAIGATILFTSGTTGQPKACWRPEACELARARELITTYGLCADDVHLVACPLAHSAPAIFLRAARAVGARTLLLERFDPAAFLAAAAHATVAFLVPTQIARILAHEPKPRWGALRALIVAGAPFPTALKLRLLDSLGAGRLWEFYGSSETGTIAVAPPSAQPGPPGFVGWPPPGVAVRLNADGEVFVRSPAAMAGYLGEPAPAEFLSVGDVAERTLNGGLVLIDRKGDVVITGGVNVYPAEVERALAEHSGVDGAVVFGRPHPDWGEEVTALVASRVGASELIDFLRPRLAGYKLPKRFIYVGAGELPIGPTGKPLRRVARARYG